MAARPEKGEAAATTKNRNQSEYQSNLVSCPMNTVLLFFSLFFGFFFSLRPTFLLGFLSAHREIT